MKYSCPVYAKGRDQDYKESNVCMIDGSHLMKNTSCEGNICSCEYKNDPRVKEMKDEFLQTLNKEKDEATSDIGEIVKYFS